MKGTIVKVRCPHCKSDQVRARAAIKHDRGRIRCKYCHKPFDVESKETKVTKAHGKGR